MYLDRLRQILDSSWNETAINAEIDGMRALLLTQLPGKEAFLDKALQPVREFVGGRRAALLAELSPAAEWPFPAPSKQCSKVVGSVRGSFETTWDSIEQHAPFKTGAATLSCSVIDGVFSGPVPETSAAAGASLTAVTLTVSVLGVAS